MRLIISKSTHHPPNKKPVYKDGFLVSSGGRIRTKL